MRLRGGGLIGAKTAPSPSAAPGVWSMADVLAARAANTWPEAGYKPDALFSGGEVGLWVLPGTFYGSCFEERTGAAATTVCSPGAPVGTYKCNITNQYAVAPSDSARPIFSVASGLTWLEFDGIDDVLETGNFALPQSWAAAAAVQFANLSGIAAVIDADRGPSNTRYAQLLRRSSPTAQSISFNTTPTAFTDSFGNVVAGAPQIMSVTRRAASVEGWLSGESDGATATTGTPASASSAVRFGASRSGSGASLTSFLSGRIYGGLFLGREYAGSERTDVEAYLRTKSGL